MLRPFFDESGSAVTRRRFLTSLAATVGFYGTAGAMELPFVGAPEPFRPSKPIPDVIAQVIPNAGVTTRFAFGDSIQELIAAGVIDPDKLRATESDLPDWIERMLAAPSADPILFSEKTAPYLVNLLWPIGLST